MHVKLAFLDTAYVYALVNTRDQWHARAAQWETVFTQAQRPLLTTEYVLIEIADGLAALRFRAHAMRIIEALRASSLVEIVSAAAPLLTDGLALFANRPDKEWGLTDCISFVVMQQRSLTDALTSDGHFTQAGFKALLHDEPPTI